MRPTPWSDDHDRLLASAEPPVPEPTTAELERLWGRVAGSLEGDAGTPGPGRRIRAGIAAGVGAVVLGTSGLAAADYFTARTGAGPVDAEDLRLGGRVEAIEMIQSAPTWPAVVAIDPHPYSRWETQNVEHGNGVVLTPTELAVALGVRPGAARVRLHRARRALAADPAVRALVEEPDRESTGAMR